jgi:hypothetical protein
MVQKVKIAHAQKKDSNLNNSKQATKPKPPLKRGAMDGVTFEADIKDNNGFTSGRKFTLRFFVLTATEKKPFFF